MTDGRYLLAELYGPHAPETLGQAGQDIFFSLAWLWSQQDSWRGGVRHWHPDGEHLCGSLRVETLPQVPICLF